MVNPLMAAQAIMGAAGLAQGIYTAVRPNPAETYNREELARLRRLRAQGNLGLTGTQQRVMMAQQQDPVSTYAMQQRQQYERIAAATGDQSGSQLAQMRREQGRSIGAAQQNAALATASASEAERQRQLLEMQQRTNAQAAYQAERWAALTGGLGQGGAALGAMLAEKSAGTSPSQSIAQNTKNFVTR
jgi:hypothetical protein